MTKRFLTGGALAREPGRRRAPCAPGVRAGNLRAAHKTSGGTPRLITSSFPHPDSLQIPTLSPHPHPKEKRTRREPARMGAEVPGAGRYAGHRTGRDNMLIIQMIYLIRPGVLPSRQISGGLCARVCVRAGARVIGVTGGTDGTKGQMYILSIYINILRCPVSRPDACPVPFCHSLARLDRRVCL